MAWLAVCTSGVKTYWLFCCSDGTPRKLLMNLKFDGRLQWMQAEVQPGKQLLKTEIDENENFPGQVCWCVVNDGLVLKWPYFNNQNELEAQTENEIYLKMCLILPWAWFGCAVAAWWVAATVNLTENRPKWPTQWTYSNQALTLFYLLFQEGMQGQDRTTYLRVN